MKELSNIKAFIETLEIRELNSEQESILLLGESTEVIGGKTIKNEGTCSTTVNEV